MSQTELAETRGLLAKAHHGLPWKIALRSANLWAVMVVGFCYVYTFYFFQSWLHTYLVKARGYSENRPALIFSAFLCGCRSELLRRARQ